MNPLLNKQLDQIEEGVDALATTLQQLRRDLDTQHHEREALQRRFWEKTKALSILEQGTHDYDELAKSHARMTVLRDDLEQRLRRLLHQIRLLSSELRA